MSWVKGTANKGQTDEQMMVRQESAFWIWQLMSDAYWNLNLDCYGEY